MYYNKSSIGRLSEFAKSAKDVLLGNNQGTMPNFYIPVLGEQKSKDKLSPKGKEPVKTEEKTVKMPVSRTIEKESEYFTQNDLEKAIIWSEILGKPLSKRRERRYYGN